MPLHHFRHNCRMRDVDCDELLNKRRPGARQMPADRPAPVMTDHNCPVFIIMINNLRDIIYQFINMIFIHAFRLVTFVVTPLVRNDDSVPGISEPVGEITDEKWDQIFDVNTKGVMRAMRKAINYWVDNDKEGTIVNTISTGGLNGAHAGVAYGASKHAAVALTKNTGWMYAKKGIRVNGIAPGSIETNIGSSMKDISEFGMERAGMTHGLSPRIGQAGEVAEAALFLGSDASSFVNGTILTVDGGWTAGF